MTAFQLLALSFFGALAAATLGAGVGGLVRKRLVVFWLLVWAAGASALVWPSSTALVARALGIGRGADLLLYVSVLAGLAGFFYVYTRFRRLDRQLTLLVRKLAIAHAARPDDAPRPPFEAR